MSNVESLYQAIAEKLVAIIPDDWNKIYLYAEVFPDMKGTYFYFESATINDIVYSLNIPEVYGVDRRIFNRLNDELRNLCTGTLYEEFAKQSPVPWSNFTMYLDHTGKFNIDYSYEPHDYSPGEQHAIWAYKILGIYPAEDDFYKVAVDKYINSKNDQE